MGTQADKEYKEFDRKVTKPTKPPAAGRRTSDFSEEFEGKEVSVLLHDGTNKRGEILEVRLYFIKLQADNEILYINKAFLVLIKVSA